jgi:sulfite exporter TauE/SafE
MGINVAYRLLGIIVRLVTKHVWSLRNKLQKCLNINPNVFGVCLNVIVVTVVISLLQRLLHIINTYIKMTSYKKIVLYRLKSLKKLK